MCSEETETRITACKNTIKDNADTVSEIRQEIKEETIKVMEETKMSTFNELLIKIVFGRLCGTPKNFDKKAHVVRADRKRTLKGSRNRYKEIYVGLNLYRITSTCTG